MRTGSPAVRWCEEKRELANREIKSRGITPHRIGLRKGAHWARAALEALNARKLPGNSHLRTYACRDTTKHDAVAGRHRRFARTRGCIADPDAQAPHAAPNICATLVARTRHANLRNRPKGTDRSGPRAGRDSKYDTHGLVARCGDTERNHTT
jgi:hypothetical protein